MKLQWYISIFVTTITVNHICIPISVLLNILWFLWTWFIIVQLLNLSNTLFKWLKVVQDIQLKLKCPPWIIIQNRKAYYLLHNDNANKSIWVQFVFRINLLQFRILFSIFHVGWSKNQNNQHMQYFILVFRNCLKKFHWRLSKHVSTCVFLPIKFVLLNLDIYHFCIDNISCNNGL